MASQKQKVRLELLCYESNCVIAAQRRYCGKSGKESPSNHSSRKWCKLFTERGLIYKGTSPGTRRISAERVNAVRAAFVQSWLRNLSDAVATVTPTMLTNVWAELEYSYFCRASHGALV
jgi:hypothetical protein